MATLGTLAPLSLPHCGQGQDKLKARWAPEFPLPMALLLLRKQRLKMTKNSKIPRDLTQSLRDTLEMGNHCTNVGGKVLGQTWRTSPGQSTTSVTSLTCLGQSSEPISLPPSAPVTLSPLHSHLVLTVFSALLFFPLSRYLPSRTLSSLMFTFITS